MTQQNQSSAKPTVPTQNKLVPFQHFIKSDIVKNNIAQTLGDQNRASRFVASVISAVSTNPALSDCEGASIVSAALLGESLQLSPSPQLGHYYMVPFSDKKRGKVAQFIIGYKGYIQLAIRSGQYKSIDVMDVREGEFKGLNPMSGQPVISFMGDYNKRQEFKIVGYMAYLELNNGFQKMIYWTKEMMEEHADKFSPAFSLAVYKKILSGKIDQEDMWKYSSFWYKDFDVMAFKTMLRQLISKWGVMSIEMQTAFTNDETIESEDGRSYPQKESSQPEAFTKTISPNDIKMSEPKAEEEVKTDDPFKV